MLLFTHKLFDTIIYDELIYSSPDYYEELATATDFLLQFRGSKMSGALDLNWDIQFSVDGSRWPSVASNKTSVFSTTNDDYKLVSVKGVTAPGCYARVALNFSSAGSGAITGWVTGRAKKSRSVSMASSIVMPSQEIITGSRISGGKPGRGGSPPSRKGGSRIVGASMATRGLPTSRSGSMRAGDLGSRPGISQNAPLLDTWKSRGRDKGCGCGGCGDKAPFEGPIRLIGGDPASCNHLIHDAVQVKPAGAALAGRFEMLTPEESNAIYASFVRANAQLNRPIRQGVDPSTVSLTSPREGLPRWPSPAPGASMLEIERAQAYRFTAMRNYANKLSPLPTSDWVRSMAGFLLETPSLQGVYDRRVTHGVASGFEWNVDLAFWVAVETQEWVCWKGYAIAPGVPEPSFPSVIAGYYRPPLGYCWGGTCEPLEIQFELEDPRGLCPRGQCPVGIHVTPLEQAYMYAAALEANRVTEERIVEANPDFLVEDYNRFWLDYFIAYLRVHCASCSAPITGFSDADLTRFAELTRGLSTVMPSGRVVRVLGTYEQLFGPGEFVPPIFKCAPC